MPSADERTGGEAPGSTQSATATQRSCVHGGQQVLVTKCLRVRIPILISVSAPSALAFDLCEAAGATLIGFARQGRHSVYCGAERSG